MTRAGTSCYLGTSAVSKSMVPGTRVISSSVAAPFTTCTHPPQLLGPDVAYRPLRHSVRFVVLFQQNVAARAPNVGPSRQLYGPEKVAKMYELSIHSDQLKSGVQPLLTRSLRVT
jgi:hypothetical protein